MYYDRGLGLQETRNFSVLIFNRYDDVQKSLLTNCRVTIGRFQGVHLGHRHLLEQLGGADEKSPKVVVTFDPPPEDVLKQTIHPKISSSQEKIKIFEQLGIDAVFLIPFDHITAQLSAEDFARQYVFELFQPQKIVVGYDFAFGKNRSGSVKTFEALAATQPKHTQVVQVGPFTLSGEVVSTSLIREKILGGDVRRACELLSRPYTLEGVVVDGAKRGRALGFPTINLKTQPLRILPKLGVYAVYVEIEGQRFNGVCNVGLNPTFAQDHQMKVECHILDFDRDVYHKTVQLHFIERLRDEKRFSGRDELVQAIHADIAHARRIFLPSANS